MNIVVFGASGGIGKAIVQELVHHGHHIFTVGHGDGNCDAHCDITDQTAVRKVFEDMISQGFSPEAVIIASGVFRDDMIPSYQRTLLDETVAVNFSGPLNIIDAALPIFLSTGKGHMIALSSTASLRPNRRGIGYPASKAALSLAMRGFDLAFRPIGITFSVVCLGPTRTKMWEGGNSFLVASPEKVARGIAKLVGSRKPVVYIPFLSTTLARMTFLVPDRVYMTLRKILLK